MAVPKPGTIEDKGVKGKVRIFIYKFDKATVCSAATCDDFYHANAKDKFVKLPTIAIKKNVGWPFCGLNSDCNMDLSTEFEDAERAQLKPHYHYKEPTREPQRIDCLQRTITDYYKANQQNSLIEVEKIWKFSRELL